MKDGVEVMVATVKRSVTRLIDPLRTSNDPSFRLSSPETHTTTADGGVGWAQRPPAFLRCPNCDSGIRQMDPRDTIDCQRCVASFSHEDFPALELVYLQCPECRAQMEHGQRHPDTFDVPEWATCHECRHHWEFQHSYGAARQ